MRAPLIVSVSVPRCCGSDGASREERRDLLGLGVAGGVGVGMDGGMDDVLACCGSSAFLSVLCHHEIRDWSVEHMLTALHALEARRVAGARVMQPVHSIFVP